MSDFIDIREKLHETSAALAKLELTIAAHPDEHFLLLNLKSLRKRHTILESQFLAMADERGRYLRERQRE